MLMILQTRAPTGKLNIEINIYTTLTPSIMHIDHNMGGWCDGRDGGDSVTRVDGGSHLLCLAGY